MRKKCQEFFMFCWYKKTRRRDLRRVAVTMPALPYLATVCLAFYTQDLPRLHIFFIFVTKVLGNAEPLTTIHPFSECTQFDAYCITSGTGCQGTPYYPGRLMQSQPPMIQPLEEQLSASRACQLCLL